MDIYNVLFFRTSAHNQENYVLTGVHKMDSVQGVYATACRVIMVKIVPFQCVHQENIMTMMQVLV